MSKELRKSHKGKNTEKMDSSKRGMGEKIRDLKNCILMEDFSSLIIFLGSHTILYAENLN